MAGHGPSPLRLDPALVKYNDMWLNRHKYFRWNARTARITIIYAVVVPGLLGWLAYTQDGKYKLRGKLRGDPLEE